MRKLMKKEQKSGYLEMPVADTEVLFLLKPSDPRHKYVLEIFNNLGSSIVVPDTALLEFEVVLRSRGLSTDEIKKALYAIHLILDKYGVNEIKTINTLLLITHLELMEQYKLSYFDSLIAASALSYDGIIISDDKDFDKIKDLRRIPIIQKIPDKT